MALAPARPEQLVEGAQRAQLSRAVEEFRTAMRARPDDWASHANLGTFHMQRGDYAQAAKCFETSSKLEPRVVGPWVNASIAYGNLQRMQDAERALRTAAKLEPENPAVNFNLGLLLGETGRTEEAKQALRTALKGDPTLAAAAYNLAVLVSKEDLNEAIQLCQQAVTVRPTEPKYAHTLAFYLRQRGDIADAIRRLRDTIKQQANHLDSYLLLAEIYEQKGDRNAAASVYRAASRISGLSAAVERQLEARARAVESP
jgi:Tfp pilus assembly protein PilF